MADAFQIVMLVLAPIILIIDAIVITTGILRKFAREEKRDEDERSKYFQMIDIMEIVGIGLGVLTLIMAGYLAVKSPDVGDWWNPITVVFMCIIGALLTLRKLEDSPIAALVALLAGFLGAAIFSVVFGDLGYGKWTYFIIFLVVDVAALVLVRTLTKQMAMIGQILNWMPVAFIICFTSFGWAIFQIVRMAIFGIEQLLA